MQRRGEAMATIHLAGNAVVLDGRVIQRCLICGEKLCDSLNVAMPVMPNGQPGRFCTWGVGAWIEQDGNRTSLVAETDTPRFSAEEIPPGCCIDLVEC